MKRTLLILACLVALVSMPMPSAAADNSRLSFVSGPVGGDWYSLAGSIGELIKQTMPGTQVTVTTGGGVGNGPMVEKGKAQLGLSQAMLYNAIQNQLEPYAKIPPAKNLSSIGYM